MNVSLVLIYVLLSTAGGKIFTYKDNKIMNGVMIAFASPEATGVSGAFTVI